MAEQDKANITSNLTSSDSNKVQVSKGKPKLKSSTVKDAISKSKTMTGARPDIININPVQEEKQKSAVFAFGRFNPPTTGHEKLINKVKDTAKSVGGEAHIIASHSEGSGKNPLSKEKKVGYIKKIAGSGTQVSSSSSDQPTLLHQLSNLHKSGVQHLTMVAGSDRVKEYHDLIHKYNGKESNHGHYNFKSIKVVSAGHRDPDAEGAEGMSGTKMREHARSGNMKSFKSGLPKALHPHAEEIAKQIRSVKESIDDMFEDAFIDSDDTHSVLNALETVKEDVTNGLFKDAIKYAEKKVKSEYETNYFRRLNDIHYKRLKGEEAHKKKVVKEDGPINSAAGGTVRGLGYVSGSPDADSPNYITNNISDADTKDNLLKKLRVDVHDKHHAVKEDVNEKFGKMREALPRSGQDRKKLDLTVRQGEDRKEDDRPYRQQSIQKKIVDEAFGKRYKSPWEKIEKAKPGIGKRIDTTVDALKQNAADYQAILDKEKKAKEVKEATTTADVAVWDKPPPKGKSGKMSPAQKAKAKARARAAGRPYPNLIDNMAAMKEEAINELSNELIGQVNKKRTLQNIPSKTSKAAATLNKAVEKVRSRTEVGKVKK